jgi:hypothetical protein
VSFLVHLTVNGWEEDPCIGEKLETWSVRVETHGAGRITRWARIWCSDALGREEGRVLHKLFGSPPLIAALLQAEPAEEVAGAAAAERGLAMPVEQ